MEFPKITFKPQWKEELLCSCELGSFTLGIPLDVSSVDFPPEDVWHTDAPGWAKPHWAEIQAQLKEWCESKKIPLYVGPYGRVG